MLVEHLNRCGRSFTVAALKRNRPLPRALLLLFAFCMILDGVYEWVPLAGCHAHVWLVGASQAGKVWSGPRFFSEQRLGKFMIAFEEKSHLMTGAEINRTLVHLAHKIVEKTSDLSALALVGIRRRGIPLAERLAVKIQQIASVKVPVGTLDIHFYRDDLSTVDVKPVAHPTQIGFSVTGKDVIVVDDVLYTGRTTRAALDALFSHGRPRRVRLCVLIDRGHRELPIEASFVGKRVATEHSDCIEVKLRETDDAEKVLLLQRATGPATSLDAKDSSGS